MSGCCTTRSRTPAGEKEPWLLRKTRYLEALAHKSESSLLVSAADKAHNACDMVLDTGRDPSMWSKFNAGLDGSAWYLLRMHQQLSHRLPQSRSTELLGEAVREILVSAPFQRIVPEGARCQQQRRAGASIKLASDSAQPPAIARGWAAQDSGPGWRVIDLVKTPNAVLVCGGSSRH